MTLPDLFLSFDSLTVLVVGDVMLDAYLWGHATRISPEAPVPIVQVIRRERRLGGAANVALNVRALALRRCCAAWWATISTAPTCCASWAKPA